jgi:hypothetical protein
MQRRRGWTVAPVPMLYHPVPAYTAQDHSTEEWSHLHSNLLELSSSLRSKRLTEGYYVSLALVFKLVEPPQDSRFGTKFLVAQYTETVLARFGEQ